MLHGQIDVAAKRHGFLARLRQIDRKGSGPVDSLGVAGGGVAWLLVAQLRRGEAELCGSAILVGGRAQVGDRRLAIGCGHLGDETHILSVAVAGRAGDLEHHAALDVGDARARPRLAQRHVVDGPVRHHDDGPSSRRGLAGRRKRPRR